MPQDSTRPLAQHHQQHSFALVALTSLFFMWGFITCLNDILIPHLKSVFSLNYTQAMLIQFCFFGAYFVVSLPAGKLVKRIGYKGGLVAGLLLAALGCALFIPAASYKVYVLFLGALFILASGVTLLQVAANPYVTVLGKAETASARLTLTQAFNSLGTTVAPWFGALLILGAAGSGADSVKFPYLLLACAFALLALIFAALKLPDVRDQEAQQSQADDQGLHSAWQYRHLVLGALGIFVYVGAEVSIGSLLVNFLGEKNIAGLAESDAAHYVSYYWGGAMVGRFAGALVMRHIRAGKVLAFNALAAVVLLALTITGQGALAMWAVLAVGLCNSIMFPTLFSLALQGLGRHTSQGSGVLCLAIVGGAVVPLLTGTLVDVLGLQLALTLPALCYLYIAYYGAKGSRPQPW
ncbi:sugar MFS transporter [Gallaecimonas kandeliae]|nr:sugar MFS transporter [Gallaecimonas kandeliae]WKE67476.1 sugar MFS transporter [Gallaecimonas kandeliae]